MNRFSTNPSAPEREPPRILSGQGLHLVSLAILLAALFAAWQQLDRPNPIAFWCAAACPIVHQVYTWLAWRCELCCSATRRSIGLRNYLVIFFVLFGSRFLSLIALAWLDRASLGIGIPLRVLIVLVTFGIGAYAAYSVIRYFGFVRAAGIDHFDPSYRERPLVKKGIFRFTDNGMYFGAFLLFWAIAVGFDSASALVIAAFSHAYIWIHYFSTEKPDMHYLYGKA